MNPNVAWDSQERDPIYVGHRETVIPFSYMIGDDVVGYSTDLCDRISDLAGKVVVTTVGTTTDRLVNSVMKVRAITIRAKSAPTQEAFSMVLLRQVDAFVMDDAILSGLLASSPDRSQLKLLEENLGFEPYGIAMRKELFRSPNDTGI